MKNTNNKKRKEDIFNSEFLPHIDSLYNFAYGLTLDENDAKDLVQETCLNAFRFIESFERGTNAMGWLYRILKNLFINKYRKKSREPIKIDYQELESYYNSDDFDEQITADLRIDSVKNMMGDEITTAINSLNVDLRAVIILCDIDGFKYDELALILDVPIGTVRSRIHTGRKLLRKKLAVYARKAGYIRDHNTLERININDLAQINKSPWDIRPATISSQPIAG